MVPGSLGYSLRSSLILRPVETLLRKPVSWSVSACAISLDFSFFSLSISEIVPMKRTALPSPSNIEANLILCHTASFLWLIILASKILILLPESALLTASIKSGISLWSRTLP